MQEIKFDSANKQYIHKRESVPENAMHWILLDERIIQKVQF